MAPGKSAPGAGQEVSGPEVVVYSTGFCGYCQRAKALLQHKGIPYREIRIDEVPGAREEMLARSNGLRTVPQIFIGERHIGGFDALHALDRSGELDSLWKAP